MGILSTIFGTDSAGGMSSAELDAQLSAMNSKDYSPGGAIYQEIQATQGQSAADAAWGQVQNDLALQQADTASQDAQLNGAFSDGLQQGISNVTGVVKNPFSTIPVAWWFIIGIGLFFYIGGFTYIRGILARPRQ